MGRKCTVEGCKTGYSIYHDTKRYSRVNPKVSVYKFPTNAELRREWMLCLPNRTLGDKVSEYMGVCALHWPPNTILSRRGAGRHPAPSVPPSIFSNESSDSHKSCLSTKSQSTQQKKALTLREAPTINVDCQSKQRTSTTCFSGKQNPKQDADETTACRLEDPIQVKTLEKSSVRKIEKSATFHKEVFWFGNPLLKPERAKEPCSQQDLLAYKELIWEMPSDAYLENYGCTVDDMATLCGQEKNGELLLSHLVWLLNKANTKSQDSLCLCLPQPSSSSSYLTTTTTTTATAQAEQSTKSKDVVISTLICVISVRRKRGGTVVIASKQNSADRRVLAVVDFTKQSVFYCDGLGWNVPKSLVKSLADLCRKWNLPCLTLTQDQVIPVHVPSPARDSGHSCTSLCRKYPSLPSSGNVNGIIAAIFATLAALDRELFQSFMEPHSSQSYGVLHDPLTHENFLRRVLISWFMNKDIEISLLREKEVVRAVTGDATTLVKRIRSQLRKTKPEVCSYCGVVVRGIFNLIRHMKRFHTQEGDRIARRRKRGQSKRRKEIPELCPFCGNIFKTQLRRHIERFHSELSENLSTRQVSSCLLCSGFRMNTMNDLLKHHREVHGDEIQVFHKSFTNELEFSTWMSELEKATSTQFAMQYSPKTSVKRGLRTYYFYCHRSGFDYSAKRKKTEEGKLHRKRKFSGKLNNYCTAFLFARVNLMNGSVNVDYCLHHIGHSYEPQHRAMSNDTRTYVIERLCQGVAYRNIWEEIRDGKNGVEADPFMPLSTVSTMKRQFDIFQVQKHRMDMQSLHLWVAELEKHTHNPVIFYKAQNSPHEILDQEDFLVCLQTDFQRSTVIDKRSRIVCVDSTHKGSVNDFVLSTVLILDELNKAIPVAWAISNREDSKVFHLFFTALRTSCKRELNTDVFVGDLTDLSYNAWHEVFPETQNRFFKSWHVESNWHAKVKSVVEKGEVQSTCISRVTELERETDEEEFHQAIQDFLIFLQQNSPELHHYFNENFVHNDRFLLWGECFRKGNLSNTDMESFHGVLKDIDLNNKHAKRIDHLLIDLLKSAQDKASGEILELRRERVSHNIQEVSTRICARGRGPWKMLATMEAPTKCRHCSCGQLCCSCHSCIHQCLCNLKANTTKTPVVSGGSQSCTGMDTVQNSSSHTSEDSDIYEKPETLINDEKKRGMPDLDTQMEDFGEKLNSDTQMEHGEMQISDSQIDDVGEMQISDAQIDDVGEMQISDAQINDEADGKLDLNATCEDESVRNLNLTTETEDDAQGERGLYTLIEDIGRRELVLKSLIYDVAGEQVDLNTQIDEEDGWVLDFTQVDGETEGKLDFVTQVDGETEGKLDFVTQVDGETEGKLDFVTQGPGETEGKLDFVTQVDGETEGKLDFVTQVGGETEGKLDFVTQVDDEAGRKLDLDTQMDGPKGIQALQETGEHQDKTLTNKDIEDVRTQFLREISDLLDFGLQCTNIDSLDALCSGLKDLAMANGVGMTRDTNSISGSTVIVLEK